MNKEEAENYIKNFKYTFISERLRNGYIGKKVTCSDGTEFTQTSRGAPFGTVVAYYDSDKEKVFYGISRINEAEEDPTPIVGLAIALRNAARYSQESITANKVKDQTEHFMIRALRYFEPELYSHSRGKHPIEVENFSQVKLFQTFVNLINDKKENDVKNMKDLKAALSNYRGK